MENKEYQKRFSPIKVSINEYIKYIQNRERYTYIVDYFYLNEDRINSRNANHLADLNSLLIKEGYEKLSERLTKLLSNTPEGKADSILEKKDILTLRGKLQSFEASRKKKKEKTNFLVVNPISYFIDELVGRLI